ncbi:hypothetical protein FBEOM_3903 [Fusarium beomiforme]|uniref:Uncharacterized protein n=1 Tax=Fusarium beomiforme TaxID=44412 RepID=A0A9P5ANW8_9HYPO|nr:hypothetical protein FBEOM_3903 [Fusarium beomiforme]
MARIFGVDVADPDPGAEDWWKDHGKDAIADELRHWIIDCFHGEIVKADEILFGKAVDEKGRPIERYVGAEKLHKLVIPRLNDFLMSHQNGPIAIHMLRHMIKLRQAAKDAGYAKWLHPLEETIADSTWWKAYKDSEGQNLLRLKE